MSAAIEKVEASEPTHLLDTDIETGIWALGITEKSISTDVVSSGIGQPGSQKQFDFVHIRYQSSGLLDGPRIFRAAFAQTKPGGWIEVVENRPPSLLPKQFVQTDSNENDGKVTGSMVTMPCGSTALETATDVACWIKHQLIDVGFVEVEEKVWRVGAAPAGPWQRFMGALVSLFSMSWVGSKESKGNCRPSINGPSVFVIARKPW
jgi:hypothetical protein